ncbi:MAG: SUMF1/EgtB/PvdO family nonheme iron enzyme [Bacteroidales bacterium]|nr:SUMF1/EgtB/PvdO family nonheme iron enzyme [Candidatus Physcousia equi]
MRQKILSLIVLFTAMLIACSKDDLTISSDIQPNVQTDQRLTCSMIMEADKQSYSTKDKTRAGEVTSQWPDGSVVYIQFQNNDQQVIGMATYCLATNLWELAYSSPMSEIVNGNCKLYYFENADDLNVKGASINGTTAIYEDLAGVYTYDGNTVTVSAMLHPKLGRVRFSGNMNDTIMLAGVRRYAYFDAEKCTYKLDSTEVLLSVTEPDGDKFFTPYYYGAFMEGNNTLQLTDMKDVFSRHCSDIFKAGNSGYMKIPHAESFNGWMKNDPLCQSAISINWPDSISEDRRSVIISMIDDMVRVEGGKFLMGAQTFYPDQPNYNSLAHSNEYPVHSTVVAPFYLGSTEVTQKQWKAVMGSNPPYSDGDLYPVRVLRKDVTLDTKSLLLSFVQKLVSITGIPFDLPTEAEWEYAAYGGRRGSYKMFAGTKIYNENYIDRTSSSPYCGHVRTKLPNEIGLYDMSGNVAEMCYSIGNYTDKDCLNPRWDKSDFVFRGGSTRDLYYYYVNGSSGYTIDRTPYSLTNRTYYCSSSSYVSITGLRICIRLINHF